MELAVLRGALGRARVSDPKPPRDQTPQERDEDRRRWRALGSVRAKQDIRPVDARLCCAWVKGERCDNWGPYERRGRRYCFWHAPEA